ncbi:hypothetical protein U0070_013607, partial [Myodes glareolus]
IRDFLLLLVNGNQDFIITRGQAEKGSSSRCVAYRKHTRKIHIYSTTEMDIPFCFPGIRLQRNATLGRTSLQLGAVGSCSAQPIQQEKAGSAGELTFQQCQATVKTPCLVSPVYIKGIEGERGFLPTRNTVLDLFGCSPEQLSLAALGR